MPRSALVGFDRASLLAATLVATSLNRLFVKMAESVALSGWTGAFGTLLGVSAVIWIALVVLIDIGGDGRGPKPQKLDWWLCGSALATCLLPTGWEAALALLLLSLASILRFEQGSRERRLGIIGLSLTGPVLFGALALSYLGPQMLRVDAMMVSLLSGLPGNGNVVEFADPTLNPGRQMVILAGCSSFHNMSLVGVLFAVVTQLLNVRLSPALWGIAAAMALVTFVINCARITAIALMPQHYEVLHIGWAAQAIAFATLLITGMLVVIGALRTAKVQHG